MDAGVLMSEACAGRYDVRPAAGSQDGSHADNCVPKQGHQEQPKINGKSNYKSNCKIKSKINCLLSEGHG
jgi:hypothetical protein